MSADDDNAVKKFKNKVGSTSVRSVPRRVCGLQCSRRANWSDSGAPNPGTEVAHNYLKLQKKNAGGISLDVKTTPCLGSSTNYHKPILFMAATKYHYADTKTSSYVLDSIHVSGMMKLKKKMRVTFSVLMYRERGRCGHVTSVISHSV
jgi:hypothetical protein